MNNIEPATAYAIIIPCCILGLLYAYINYGILDRVKILSSQNTETDQMINNSKSEMIIQIGSYIQEGSKEFLYEEYRYLGIFISIFALVIFVAVDLIGQEVKPGEQGVFQIYTTVAFIVGAVTSIISGYIGMQIATFSNTKVAHTAQISLESAFCVAYRAGCVMGFCLTSLGLLILTIMIAFYRELITEYSDSKNQRLIYEAIAGYGLGGSTVALFARVGGGIYTKAADVGADLVGKFEHDLPEDSPKNPATIADNVGDNVGDIAGMGADLFGSFAESTCAALVILSQSPTGLINGAMFFPLLISALGIVVSFITSFFATNIMKVNHIDKIERTLKWQLIISTIILTPVLYIAAVISLPDELIGLTQEAQVQIPTGFSLDLDQRSPVDAWICTLVGLWGGLIIGAQTEYMTSFSYDPVQELVKSCETGAATNIIYGLALGYKSTIIPVFVLAVVIYICFERLFMFGIALGALGMLSNLAISLAIDAYGPISDNAGGIAEMSELGENVRQITDALDAAGNTTAAIGKGFAIGSAALVSLSLFGAFMIRSGSTLEFQILDKMIITCLLIGSMLPYWFSAMTMKSVGMAAMEMVYNVREQLKDEDIRNGNKDPDYKACIKIATKASLKQMIGPGVMVIGTPLIFGLLFGPKAIVGLLPGALVSSVQMAISSSNSGGAWDNAKKYYEAKKMKNTDPHKAAVIGDTVGDPLKDTSGPSLNILMKLMAILSLVFCSFFQQCALLKDVKFFK